MRQDEVLLHVHQVGCRARAQRHLLLAHLVQKLLDGVPLWHRHRVAVAAEAIAAAVRGCELEPLLTDTAVPTPACSWAVVERKALGALVITASHNPPEWLGLKIKTQP